MRAEDNARLFFGLRPDRIPPKPAKPYLDEVSRDIRELEAYFLESAPRVPLEIEFHDSGIISERGQDLDTYEGPIHQEIEVVAWEPLGDGSSWHLTYRRIRREGVMAPMGGMDGPTFDHVEALEHCPLVEAPARDRIRAHRALPDLVQEAGAIAGSRARSA